MKSLTLARSLLFALLASTLPGLAGAQNPEDTVSLNFANAEISSVIEAIGKISGRNFLIDPRVKGTLNIVTNTPVSRDLSYQILLSALRLQGFTAVDGPGVTKIVPEADAKLHAVPVASGGRRDGDSLVTQVFALRHESANQMVSVVRPLVSPNNTVTAFPSNNVLVVTDYADNIARIGNIIESIDVPQGDVTVVELKHAIAIDLAATLTRLMGEGNNAGGAEASLQPVQIVPEPRTNSLLLRADNPSQIRSVRQLISSLDRPGAGGNIHVVYLRNAEAVKVAQTLNAALAGDGSALASNDASLNFSTSSTSTSTTSSSDGLTSGDGKTLSGLSQSNGASPNAGSSGIVQADPVNNALIIVAPDSVYRNLRAVIDQLDRRRAQVYIEALIAEISTERAAEFGIQWQSANMPSGNGSTGFGGTNFGGEGQNIIGAMGDISSLGKGMNLLIGSGTISVPINGEMVDIFSLSMLARFLETDSRTNILSTPTIVTLDNEEAKIVVGRNLPFITGQYTNTGGGTTPANPFQTIERRDVGLTLEVRPQISEGGTIKLDIYQEASSVVPTVDNSSGPITNKRSIKSTVLVDDGAIIALGGLVEDSSAVGEEKVPFLGDIPFAGNLFRYDSRRRTKTNLVVFLRPVILRDQESYEQITQSRYEYVIGQQTGQPVGRKILRGEAAPPMLPPLARVDPEREEAPAPVREAMFIRVNADSAQQ